jgi:hypothetical protein
VIDDILAEIFREATAPLTRSRRFQLVMRVGFGLLGMVLSIVGTIHFLLKQQMTNNMGIRISLVALFVFLACFFLFNVALARRWRWPGFLFVLSFVSVFVSRIFFGP